MLARPDTVATIAGSWLAQLEAALAGPPRSRLKELFHPDSHWRDVLAKSARRFVDELRERIELMRKHVDDVASASMTPPAAGWTLRTEKTLNLAGRRVGPEVRARAI